jgi:hypothetical protein
MLFRRTGISNPGIHGLATHEVYPRAMSPPHGVSSYLTFSPLPRLKRGGNFLWHLLLPPKGHLPVRKHGALCCPDFPPPGCPGSDRSQQTCVKLRKKERQTGYLTKIRCARVDKPSCTRPIRYAPVASCPILITPFIACCPRLTDCTRAPLGW